MDEEKPVIVGTTEARQANSRRMNLRVLVVGILVVALGFALLYLFYFQPDTTL